MNEKMSANKTDLLSELRAYKENLRVAAEPGPLAALLADAIAEIERLRSLAGCVSHDQLSFAEIKKSAKCGDANSKTPNA